jgi:hypothetical protein
MDFVVAVFGFGSLLLLIAVLGGGLTAGGITVPPVRRTPRLTAGIVGSALMLVSGGLWAAETLRPEQAGVPSAAGPPSRPLPVEPSPGNDGVVSDSPVVVRRELLLRHARERLDISINQRPAVSLMVDKARPSGSLHLVLAGEGPFRYEATLIWVDDQGEEGVFHGRGALDPRSGGRTLRATLNFSSASVVLEPD